MAALARTASHAQANGRGAEEFASEIGNAERVFCAGKASDPDDHAEEMGSDLREQVN